jgi:hypothetical protein
LLSKFKKTLKWGFGILVDKAGLILHGPRKSSSPLADRLLADALRLVEIPSPSPGEEQRAAFILERLKSLGLVPRIDGDGNIFVRVHAESTESEEEPGTLLLFSEFGSRRWHPLESLSRLDKQNARGAGLAGVLGAAALLSAAESLATGTLEPRRDVFLLFAARPFDDPRNRVFLPIIESPINRPFAAIGVQGLTLGTLAVHARGSYRMEITIFPKGVKNKDRGGDEIFPVKEKTEPSGAVTDTLITAARTLSGIIWDGEGKTRLYIRRLEASTLYGHTPSEGLLEVELDSSDGTLLEMAKNAVKATAENLSRGTDLRVKVTISSFIPVGDSGLNAALAEKLRDIMKELRIKVREERGPDPSAFLSRRGIAALSVGIAQGREGISGDVIEIASIEKGRRFLEKIIVSISGEGQ